MAVFEAKGLFYKAGEGSGGSDPHNLGYYADLTALQTAHPTGTDGDFAILGSTDTIWVWDSGTSAWVDSDRKGQVTSVNNQTGDVTVQETLVSGTNIKTINGNSVLGSGDLTISGGGIEWAASIDKPQDAQTGTWNTNSGWVISGGLPDGMYEYYFKVLLQNFSSNETPACVVYKVVFRLYTENNTQYAVGDLRYVYNGDTQPRSDSSYMPFTYDTSWSDYFWKDGSDLIIFNYNTPFCSHVNSAGVAVSKVFEISKITNIDTGTTYTPTGHLYVLNEEQNWDGYIGGINAYQLVTMPTINTQCSTSNYGWYGSECFSFCDTWGVIATGNQERNISEFDFSADSSMDGKFHAIIENSCKSYRAKILEQTGDFANAKLMATRSGSLMFNPNFSTNDSRTLTMSVGLKGANKNLSASIGVLDPSSVAVYSNEIVYETVGSTITPNNLGVIAQYNEEIPNVAYTKGQFYQATGTLVTVPSSMTCTETSSTGTTITCSDADAFVDYLNRATNVPVETIKWYLTNGYTSFSYDENDNWYWSAGWNGTDSEFGTYFTFSPSMPSWLEWEVTFTDSYQEVQNPAWVQYNTQPMSTGTTGTLVAANWAGGSQTITVNGVTASNNVVPTPAPASAADWASAGILCTAQSTDSLTFTCTQTPSNDITVNVLIFD